MNVENEGDEGEKIKMNLDRMMKSGKEGRGGG